jgi:hypothetical protein
MAHCILPVMNRTSNATSACSLLAYRWLTPFMNKGKPSGFKADTKKDAGAKSTSRERSGQAGAGPEWTERNKRGDELIHAAGDGGPEQNAGGRNHRGGRPDEDRNP